MIDLAHVIYSSRAVDGYTKQQILDILSRSRANNERLGVTGMLLLSEGSFLQVLEGEKEVIKNLFMRIAADKRHANVVKIIDESIANRSFSDWSMGYAEVSRDELGTIDGLNDFFTGNRCLADVDSGRARKLLKAFQQGRWRSRQPVRQA